MTQQQIFDKVATHLLTQGAKSMMGDTCRYRGSNGAKCAVGCLIKDDHYDPILELRSSRSELVKEALIKSKVDIRCSFLLLQFLSISFLIFTIQFYLSIFSPNLTYS